MKAYEIVAGPPGAGLFTAETFLSYLRRSNPVWWDKDVNGMEVACPWVFRGHADADTWELMPSALRPVPVNLLTPILKNMEVWKYTEPLPPNWTSLVDQQMRLLNAYLHAVSEFRDLAVNLGLADLPPMKRPIGSLINLMGAERLAMDTIEVGEGTIGSFIPIPVAASMLAQHHGIPTILLDWTRRPEVAAQFASSDEGLPPGSKDIAVYALRYAAGLAGPPRYEDGPRSRIFAVVAEIPSKNRYLAAQQGIFTYTVDPEYPWVGSIKSLEKLLLDQDMPVTVLRKVVLQAREVPRLRYMLDREELSEAHLKPTLDNVAKTIMARFKMPSH